MRSLRVFVELEDTTEIIYWIDLLPPIASDLKYLIREHQKTGRVAGCWSRMRTPRLVRCSSLGACRACGVQQSKSKESKKKKSGIDQQEPPLAPL